MTHKNMLFTLLTVLSAALLWDSKVQAQTNTPTWTTAAPPSLARQELYPEVLTERSTSPAAY